jgi:ATP/maltotriose-dependent transcriptional regulator MalT
MDTSTGAPGTQARGWAAPALPLVTSKIHPPPAVASYRGRPRLDARLDRALDDATRLTLVSAPPGYGKSVAVRGWLAARSIPHAWLSLDAADNDPARFFRYLLAALAAVRSGIESAPGRLVGAGEVSPETTGAILIDVIGAADTPFVLVLDDYHVIVGEPVHALVRLLIERGPPFSHVIVVTREDPPFSLARLRAHGRLIELRAQELRYGEDEARTYFADQRLDLDAGRAMRLVERTEGWIAGLQLAAIAMRDRPDADALVDAFAGSQRFVLDYLAAEVLGRLDPELRTFLMQISVADRFSADLCRALTGRADSEALLEHAERQNLFLVPLDLERHWYRFHHLFADYLRTLLDAPARTDLAARAAAWFEREGLFAEAIEQALTAGALDRAVGLIEGAAPATYAAGELGTLLRWLDALPPERVRANAPLTARAAAAFLLIGRFEDAARMCTEGEARVMQRGEDAPQLVAVHALLDTLVGHPDGATLARTALERLGDDDEFRPLALQALGTAQVGAGDLRAGAMTMRVALDAGLAAGRAPVVIPALTVLATALNLSGRRGEAEAWCRQVLANYGAARAKVSGGLAYAAFSLGIVRYEAGDLAEARDLLERGWDAAATFGRGRLLFGTAVGYLVLARLASGDIAAAFEATRNLRQEAQAARGPTIEPSLVEIEARLHVKAGDIVSAARWADAVEGHLPEGWPGLPVTLTLARVRLAQGRMSDARILLGRARAVAAAAADHADLISIAVCEARVNASNGDHRRAQRGLEEAVRLAAAEGYVRRIMDEAGPLARLLPAARHIAPAFFDRLIAALVEPVLTPVPARSSGGALWVDTQGQPFEALTARELDVLRLLARGCGDAAVADELGVSLATAKWHAAHVRSKLGARSRTQALLRARELGLV